MSILMQANAQWSSRPNDERFTSLTDLLAHCNTIRAESANKLVATRDLTFVPTDKDGNEKGDINAMRDLRLFGPNGHGYEPTHWAFTQACQHVKAPASYLRGLPAPMAADCLNYGLRYGDDVNPDLACLLQKNGSHTLRAVTGQGYGRVWNSEVVGGLVDRFGDGVTGDWRVPGEFGKRLDMVTKDNTTLFASDRDMFVFLADEDHRIEIPNRRDGQSGSLARGFFVWNSEVGAKTLGVAMFLFDYVCCNRIVWGATQYKEVKIRHTSSASYRWLDDVRPVIRSLANSSSKGVIDAIENARAKRISDRQDEVTDWLSNRFGQRMGARLQAVHKAEEGRPVETLWDAATAATAYARSITYQDDRVDLERKAGKLLDLAS